MPNTKKGFSARDLREVSDNPEWTAQDFRRAKPFAQRDMDEVRQFARDVMPAFRGARIAAELFRRQIDVSIQASCGAVIQRMCQGNIGLNPFKTESLQRKRLKKWRTRGQWMNRRTNVVHKPWQRECRRARPAADGRVRFPNEHGTSRARQRDCRSKTIRSRADYDRIVFVRHESRSRAWRIFFQSEKSSTAHRKRHVQPTNAREVTASFWPAAVLCRFVIGLVCVSLFHAQIRGSDRTESKSPRSEAAKELVTMDPRSNVGCTSCGGDGRLGASSCFSRISDL